ncbi:CpaD family pilus assembly protein [Novosphingobium marinum]|uniref:Pilus assembly protein CpaD n=1 Tax=Novosphingobium marinum TaxID=1514948 RepID=A0A7Z0BVN7_9SPHN|nr:CpaD family pilus assembly protein [Novosphingobium marinum]NYH96468.1 pilus assembly protein CpaD [Novosphingobium marinum]
MSRITENPARRAMSGKAIGTAIALGLGLALAGCGGIATNQSLYSVNQPVVERTNYTLDLNTGPGGLSYPEQRRLAGWFEAMDLRYGDRIAVDDPLNSGATMAAIEGVAGRYGLLVSGEAPVTPGYVEAGTARVVITRSRAYVPNCPNWSDRSDANPLNATSSNYGCAVNSNIASMVADPEHLLKGAEGGSQTVVMSSTKAIDSYREQPLTGKGGLGSVSSKGE